MYLKTLSLAAAMSVVALSAQSATLSFDHPDLVAGTEDGSSSDVTVAKDGVTLTAVANSGAVRVYNTTAANGGGLYFGAITSGPFNTISNTSAPASGSYGLEFSQAITSITFVFDWLSKTSLGEETLSLFSTNNGAVTLSNANFTNLGGTGLNAVAQTINTAVSRGKGSVTYSGADFTGFYFDHAQDPRNIGFTVTNVSVELAPVPLPAALPMLAAAMGGLGLIRVQRRKPA